jgi:hypothetical protein
MLYIDIVPYILYLKLIEVCWSYIYVLYLKLIEVCWSYIYQVLVLFISGIYILYLNLIQVSWPLTATKIFDESTTCTYQG